MNVYLHRLATRVPRYAYRQDYARDCMTRWLPGKRSRRLIRGIYDHSGIETRYSVLPDFVPGAEPILFRESDDGTLDQPGTKLRNDRYTAEAGGLAAGVAGELLAGEDGFRAEDITHLVTASCTGFCNPGPDLEIVRALGLPDRVERYHVGFMGCYAAFPALRMAEQFCRARPDAVVLVVCVELCSLHLQLREEPDSLLANALFADGAGGALVSARAPRGKALVLRGFSSALAVEGEADMAWSIGDLGFDIRLSTYVPSIIEANLASVLDRAFTDTPWGWKEIGDWAVHPGGRAILDKVEQALGLSPEALEPSRTVLRDYGNMSSATILFVLKRILDASSPGPPGPICAMAFGPGLTIETALLERVTERAVPSEIPARRHEQPAPA